MKFMDNVGKIVEQQLQQPLVKSVTDIFRNTWSIQIVGHEIMNTSAVPDDPKLAGAFIQFANKSWAGHISLWLPDNLILHIVNVWLEKKYETLNAEAADCLGEILNMIFGSAKRAWNNDGYNFPMAIPKSAPSKSVSSLPWKTKFTIRFDVQPASFYIEVDLMPLDQQQSA